MGVIRQVLLLVGKELRIEARSRQTIGLIIVLGILIVTVLGKGLARSDGAGAFSAPAVLLMAYLFGGVLCFEKTMGVERHDDALAGLLLAPVDRGVIYVGKLLSNLILMLGLAIVVTPVGIMFFQFELGRAPWVFVTITLLFILGFAAVGTLFAAAVSSSKLQGGLLAMIIFPLSLPLVIAATELMARVFDEGRALGGGVMVLVAFDVIFLVASWMVFELLLEP